MKLSVEIDGEQVPLDDCTWVLRKPCGCASRILPGVAWTKSFASEADAWGWFHWFWYPLREEREKRIREDKAAGWSVQALRTDDAHAVYLLRCPHRGGGSDA